MNNDDNQIIPNITPLDQTQNEQPIIIDDNVSPMSTNINSVVEPVVPTAPVASVAPVVEPVVSTAPVEPIAPVVEPVVPTIPVEPIASVVEVVVPTAPVEPIASVVEVVVPTAPVEPISSVVEPIVPITPVVPVAPVVEPITPIEEVPTSFEPIPAPVINEPVIDTPIVPPTNDNMEPMFYDNEMGKTPKGEKGKTVKKIILFILVFIALVVIALGGFFIYSHSEKVIIDNSFKHLEGFKDYFNKPFELKKSDNYSLTGNMKASIDNISDTTNSEYNQFNQYINLLNKFNFDYAFNVSSDKSLIKLGVNQDKENLFGIKLYSTTNSSYIFLEKLYDKYIEVEDLKLSLTSKNKSIEDYKYLSDFALDSIVKHVDKDKFKKDTTTIRMDEIEKKVKKVDSLTISYNDKELCELLDLVITDIKNDDRAHEIVKDSYEDFDNYKMDDTMKNIDEDNMSIYTYVVYTDRLLGTVQGIDLEVGVNTIESVDYSKCYSVNNDESNLDDDTPVVSDEPYAFDENGNVTIDESVEDDYDISTNDDIDNNFDDCAVNHYKKTTYLLQYRYNENPTINLLKDNTFEGSLEFVKGDEVFTININNKNIKNIGSIKITSNKSLYEVNANLNIDDTSINIKNSINIKEVKAKEEYNLDGILTFEAKQNNINKFKATVTTASTLKTSSSVDENVGSAIKMSEISSDDATKIYYDFMKIITEKMSLQ